MLLQGAILVGCFDILDSNVHDQFIGRHVQYDVPNCKLVSCCIWKLVFLYLNFNCSFAYMCLVVTCRLICFFILFVVVILSVPSRASLGVLRLATFRQQYYCF